MIFILLLQKTCYIIICTSIGPRCNKFRNKTNKIDFGTFVSNFLCRSWCRDTIFITNSSHTTRISKNKKRTTIKYKPTYLI